jgi:hypothetical protein
MGPAPTGTTADRRFLYWAVFFIALGAIALAIDERIVDPAPVASALRLWPIAIVAVIVAVLLRRTPYGVPASLAAAALFGLAIGGGVAAGPRVTLDCTTADRPALTSAQGSFEGAATVTVSSACGSLAVSTASGSTWRVESGDPGRATARVASSPTALDIDAGTSDEWDPGSSGGADWRVTVPTSRIDALGVALSAGNGKIDLAGADVGSLRLTGSATQLRVDLSQATVSALSASIRLGGLTLLLPDADLTGNLDVTVGQVDVCLPADVGLRVHRQSDFGVVKYQGFEQHAVEWQSPGYAQAAVHVDVTVTPGLGGVEFDPIRGCSR